jgi:long-chain acyl-CoA synthetase
LRTGDAFAVLDPTWPQAYLGLATGQVEDAVSGGVVGNGDMVVFSSGSTGRPRGIVRTFESWRASFAGFSDITGITSADTVWLPGPLWSSLFLYGALHAAEAGASVLLRDDEPAGATALHCVPSQLPGLLHRAQTGGLPLVRRVVVAGDRCTAALRQQCEQAGWHLVEYYGAAELSIVAWRDHNGGFRSFPGVQTQLRETGFTDGTGSRNGTGLKDGAGSRNGTGLKDGAGATETLWARSPYVVGGYLSADADGPFRLDPQGWATVGDLARAVMGGLEVLGRGNLAVTTGGHTVVVEEVERLLRRLPGVDDVAVLGVAHPRLGQLLAAIVVGSAEDASLRAAVAKMPTPSRPRRWLHADALPRTSGGKLRRDALPDLVAGLSRS